MDQAILVALVMLVCVLTMLVLGIPISISIGLASTIAMLFVLPFENAMGTAAQKVFTGVNSFSLLAIPFFILAGNIMNNGGIAIRLVNCAKILSGRMPGALAETNVVANMLFGASAVPVWRQPRLSAEPSGRWRKKRVIQRIIWRLSILHPHPREC